MDLEASLDRFFGAAERVVAELGPGPKAFRRIGDLLRTLAQDATLIDESRLAVLHGTSAAAAVLGHGPSGSALMLARFPAEAPTPVHNHNSWGVIHVIRGRDRHVLWAREDDGSVPGRARLQAVESRDLESGDVAWFPAEPGDIHSQQGIGEAAWELVYFARDPNARPRMYFDPDRGLVEERAAV